MILVTRLNGSKIYVNADLIQMVESTPDTIINLTSGIKLLVREPASTVAEMAIAYRRRIHQPFETADPANSAHTDLSTGE